MQKEAIGLDNLTAVGMIPVVRKRDIIKFKTLSKDERQRYDIANGGPDILAETPSGQTKLMYKEDIINNYRYTNGSPVKIAGLRTSQYYTVIKNDETNAVAAMIPLNCTVQINGRAANSSNRKRGDYVVALLDESGNIDTNTLGIIPAAMFRKMYYIPPNDVISRNIGKGEKLFYPRDINRELPGHRTKQLNTMDDNTPMDFGSNDIPEKINDSAEKTPDYASALNIDTKSIDFGIDDMYSQKPSMQAKTNMNLVKMPEQAKEIQQMADSLPKREYQYSAIGRLLKDDKLVGFIIQDKHGNTKKINIKQMMELCENHLVSNIMISVKSETGKKFLRGNNIRIDALSPYSI